ncbi:hypothetical protein ACUN9Y_04725 [Halomonas sp. V046]|uniref:hypothetical protein n=1 Tax=Halomonas sp. V046 TaxID=3459611 RepID=UPI004043E2BB
MTKGAETLIVPAPSEPPPVGRGAQAGRRLIGIAVALVGVALSGCEALPFPHQGAPEPVQTQDLASCDAEVPSFAKNACMVSDWIAFGLAAQRGDSAWRDDMLTRLQGYAPEQRLGRAVVLAWGTPAQWNQASEYYKADLSGAPSELQPLLRYWLNEVEGRRARQGRVTRHDGEVARLREENKALADKLEAMTAIEQSINLRQQVE